ncbi:MAG: sodium-dependent transporter [Bacteroidales bacterium]|nr:sodium-dependent transporter [Bacteroidales bacterium]
MAKFDFSKRDSFGSKIGIIAAAAGSAIGLGNIWRFPYVAGENGGGAFLLIYLLFVFLIGMPVMLSEFVIGRGSQRNPMGAFRLLAPGSKWFLAGIIGIIAAFLILAFYSTVAGWTLEYLYQAIGQGFKGKDTQQLSLMFDDFHQSGLRPVIWQTVFMFLTAFIVFNGIKNGIEKYTKILMPALFLIIIGLGIRAVTLPGAGQGLAFLFQPDFSKINANTMLQALGQAFFSLSLGMGTMITYGSYVSKKDRLPNITFSVTLADFAISILAGIAIFPAVFAFNIAPESGAGLVFITLPMIFEQIPGGYFFSIIFFVLLSIAALTSTISLLEVAVACFSEELGISRKKATIISALSINILGIFCTLSQGPLPKLSIMGKNLFDMFDFVSANIMLPMGGFFIVVFLGWKMDKKVVFNELTNNNSLKFSLQTIFMFIIKYIAPVAIGIVFLNGLGILDMIGL